MSKWILPIGVLILFEFFADILAEEWALKHRPWFWVLALLFYMLGNVSWLIAMKNGSGLGRGAMVFSVCSALLAITVGVLVYKEHVTDHQALGIILGFLSLGLILWE